MTFQEIIKPFKNIWQVIFVMSIVNTLVMYYVWRDSFSSWGNFGIATIWGTTIWVSLSVGNSFIFNYLDQKFPWRRGLAIRAVLTTISVGVYSASAYLIIQIIMFSIFFSHVPFMDVILNTLGSVWITVSIAFTISFILTIIGFAKALVKNEIENERLQKEMMSYKYESLRNQINPHFLFNSFNVLIELVHENQDLAVRFIQQLSNLYRYVLDSTNKELVSIDEELEFIRSFTFLLQTRFESRVIFKIDVDNTEGMIIPMALQLLIENGIKHNEASTKNPLTISITRNKDAIVVTNNLKRKASHDTSLKIGLKNLKERYSFFDKNIDINETETEYMVCVPILKIQNN